MRCAVRRQATDRVPVAPYLGNHGARVAGVPIGEYGRSGRLMAQAQYRAWEVYGQDAVEGLKSGDIDFALDIKPDLILEENSKCSF